MAMFALKQTVDFSQSSGHTCIMCFLDAKKAFRRVNHFTLAKKLLDGNVPLHIVKLFIFWYREQEFMVRWGNSLSMTFRCSNGIRQGGQLLLVPNLIVWPSKSSSLRKSEQLAGERHWSSGLLMLCCVLMCVSVGQWIMMCMRLWMLVS